MSVNVFSFIQSFYQHDPVPQVQIFHQINKCWCWSNHRGHQSSYWPSTVPDTRSEIIIFTHFHENESVSRQQCYQIWFLGEEQSIMCVLNSFVLNSSSVRRLVSIVFQVGSQWPNYDLMTSVAKISPLKVSHLPKPLDKTENRLWRKKKRLTGGRTNVMNGFTLSHSQNGRIKVIVN